MEGHCSTGQSPQWAVVPMEEEEEEEEEEEKRIDLRSSKSLHNDKTDFLSRVRSISQALNYWSFTPRW